MHRQLLDFSPDGLRTLPASKRQYLIVGGFGAQGLGNRLQWMTTFFWLALITNRAVLFEDDPKGKVLVLSDFLVSNRNCGVAAADPAIADLLSSLHDRMKGVKAS